MYPLIPILLLAGPVTIKPVPAGATKPSSAQKPVKAARPGTAKPAATPKPAEKTGSAAPAPASGESAASAGAKPAAPAQGATPKAASPVLVMAFSPAKLDLAPGESYPVELVVPSPTRKHFQGALTYTSGKGGAVKPDARWTGKVPPWGVKTYPVISAAPDAAGDFDVVASLDKGASATLPVKVVRPKIEPVPGYMMLTVKVTNPFRKRLLKGRIIASNPDRFLEDVTTREFRVEPGQTAEVVFPLPGASPADGEKYDFTLAVETYEGYRDKKTYPLEFPPQPEKPF